MSRARPAARTILKALKNPSAYGPLLAIRNEKEYDRAVIALEALVDEIGDHPGNQRYRFIDTLSVLIEAYDDEHHAVPDASGVEVLRYLMEQHRLSQSDLPEVGSQGVVSEILSGKRTLNVNQIQALAKRFGIQPGAFLSKFAGEHA
jgi:HTH-type transcriptional regulator/antitoxin HigA